MAPLPTTGTKGPFLQFHAELITKDRMNRFSLFDFFCYIATKTPEI